MNSENHYCCRCHRTTKFVLTDPQHLLCSGCGLVAEKHEKSVETKGRALIGDPFRSYKTSFAA